ncbi:PQQ-binding-like beta-propeller repeat protein [Actinoplanes sp. NPDC051494]|uniref:PQQ-binding-like beta-propeller repeat protein n=1 Tax=Actinoplanes sp. NPDC051494 TaxID=3363907 RepID=UPI003792C36B
MRISRVLLTAAALTLVTATPAPAFAAGAVPEKAPLFNGSVYAVATSGSVVYVGGSFTSVAWGGQTYPRARLAAFDTSSRQLLPWAPGADRTVRALAVSDTSVYAGGDFTSISGLPRDNLARLDAGTGVVGAFAHRVTGTPYALATGNGRLYAGGSFSAVDGAKRGNLAAFSLSLDTLDSGWKPRADDAVHAVVVAGATVYAGGAFHKVGGVNGTVRLAALSATSGAASKRFLPKPPAQVNAIATDAAGVYAATGGQGGRAIAYRTDGKQRWQRVFDGDASSIATVGGTVYVGGHFDRACRTEKNGAHGTCSDGSISRVKLAAISGRGALTGWAPQANGVIGVRALTAGNGLLVAGGDFTSIAGQNRKRLAYFRP